MSKPRLTELYLESRKVLVLLLLAVGISLVPSLEGQAATYYVRTDGHDTASGLNNTSNPTTGAFRTINKAASVVDCTDTVRVQGGTYVEAFDDEALAAINQQNNLGCGAGSPIMFQCDAANYGCHVSTSCSTYNGSVLWDMRVDYETIKGFDLNGASCSIVLASRGSNDTITGNKIHGMDIGCHQNPDSIGAGAGLDLANQGTNSGATVTNNLIYSNGKATSANITAICRGTACDPAEESGVVKVTTATGHGIEGSAWQQATVSGVPGFNGTFPVATGDVWGTGTVWKYIQEGPDVAGTIVGNCSTGGACSTNGNCGYNAGIYGQIPNVVIQNNIIYQNFGPGIKLQQRSANSTISNNLVFGNKTFGITLNGSDDSPLPPSSVWANSIVSNNILIDNVPGGLIELWAWNAPGDTADAIGAGNLYLNNVVFRNASLVFGTQGVAVCDGTAPTCSHTLSLTAASCAANVATVTTATAHNAKIGWWVTVTGVNPSGYNVTNVPVTATPTPTTFSYAVASCPGTYVSGGSETSTLTSTQAGTLTSDPLFVNYQDDGSGDYHLAAGSPCIGSGVPDGAPAFDFDGTPRPQGGTHSIGPYERWPQGMPAEVQTVVVAPPSSGSRKASKR
jgi:parallel beta-helix repeat protein